jgi:asparagine synthetase B (glutamine-hydrolysing)
VKWGYCPETWRTPYWEVRKTLPGEHVELRRFERPARRRVDTIAPVVAANPDELKIAIEEAARHRATSSDVPVACLVSGGLDSAIAYTLASRHADVSAYHVENGERDEAEKVVGRGVSIVDPGYATVDLALSWMQEPVDLGSLLPQVALSRVVAERVCLTGDGADELFGGYGRAQRYDSQASDVWHELVAWHLPRLDRVMMRNRIEVRTPFLARRVVEMALGLPRELRTGKRVIRDLFRGDLPRGIADTPKRPLRTPVVEGDREGWSRTLVEKFRRVRWPK